MSKMLGQVKSGGKQDPLKEQRSAVSLGGVATLIILSG